MAKINVKEANAAFQKQATAKYGKAPIRVDLRSHIDNADVWVKTGKWVLVKSSNVRAIRFEKPSQRLWARFKNGSEYHYRNVTTRTAKRMFYSASMGRFIWFLRRNGYIGIKS